MKNIKDKVIKSIKQQIIWLMITVTYYIFNKFKKNKLSLVFYNLYKVCLRCFNTHPYELISHKKYLHKHISSSIQTITSSRIGYTSELCYDNAPPHYSMIPTKMSDIYVAIHSGVKVHGKSEFILNERAGLAINDFDNQANPSIEIKDGILLKKKDNLLLLKFNNSNYSRKLKSGILLTGKFSHNYYHLIYEVLIKLLVIDKTSIPINVPLIIDKVVFEIPSFCEIFEILNETKREIIVINKKEMLFLETLYWISPINEIPAHISKKTDCRTEDIVFDIGYLYDLKNKLIQFKSNTVYPKRIFLTRKSFKNRRFNEDEVISLLKTYGFIVISPEEHSFSEQVSMFNGADIIVGGSGAAMSNVIFCNSGCTVICLYSMKIKSPAFSTISYANKVDFRYVVGEGINHLTNEDIHSDFYVNIDKVKIILNHIIETSR